MAMSAAAMPLGTQTWYNQDHESLAAELLYKQAIENDSASSGRREWAGKLAGLYENLKLSSFHELEYQGAPIHLIDGDTGGELVWEEAASLMDTFQSKIAALDEPKPQVLVTDGTFTDKRKAQWLDRFILGQYTAPQGMFTDLWDMWRHAFLIAATATGTAAVKFIASSSEKRVIAELHDTLDMWCDDHCGYPLTWGESTWVDGERLADETDDGNAKDVIWKAMRSPRDANPRTSIGWNRANLVRLVEGWRVKVGDSDGAYCATVEGYPIDWKDYPYDSPPHVFLTPKRRLKGMWGRPVLQMVRKAILEENRVINAVGEAERRSPNVWLFYDPEIVAREKLSLPKNVTLVPYDSTRGKPPMPFPPPFFHQNSIQYIDMHAQRIHDIPGLPEMHTAAKKPQGIEAAVAIRAVEGMLTERHATAQRALTRAVAVDSAKQIARACAQLAKEEPRFMSTWKGQGFLRTVPAGKVLSALEDERYTYDVQAVSGTKNTPADRLQNLWDMMERGVITPEGYEAARRTMDSYGESKKFEKQRQFIDMEIERFLDSSPSDVNTAGFYEPPDKWLDEPDAMAQVSDAMLQARMDKAPSHVHSLLLMYLGDLSDSFDQKRLREAEIAGVSRGAQAPAQPLSPRAVAAPNPAAPTPPMQPAAPAAAPVAA